MKSVGMKCLAMIGGGVVALSAAGAWAQRSRLAPPQLPLAPQAVVRHECQAPAPQPPTPTNAPRLPTQRANRCLGQSTSRNSPELHGKVRASRSNDRSRPKTDIGVVGSISALVSIERNSWSTQPESAGMAYSSGSGSLLKFTRFAKFLIALTPGRSVPVSCFASAIWARLLIS